MQILKQSLVMLKKIQQAWESNFDSCAPIRSHVSFAEREGIPLPAWPQSRDGLGGVRRPWVAELCQTESCFCQRCEPPAGIPEVSLPLESPIGNV